MDGNRSSEAPPRKRGKGVSLAKGCSLRWRASERASQRRRTRITISETPCREKAAKREECRVEMQIKSACDAVCRWRSGQCRGEAWVLGLLNRRGRRVLAKSVVWSGTSRRRSGQRGWPKSAGWGVLGRAGACWGLPSRWLVACMYIISGRQQGSINVYMHVHVHWHPTVQQAAKRPSGQAAKQLAAKSDPGLTCSGHWTALGCTGLLCSGSL